jgi:hypothetical protein
MKIHFCKVALERNRRRRDPVSRRPAIKPRRQA